MHRRRPSQSLAAALAFSLPLVPFACAMTAASPQQDAPIEGDRIIVESLSPHRFQDDAPDDPGTALAAEDISLPQLLATLGPDATLWYQHVLTLSNPFFEGRRPGSAGNKYAADYIEFWFRQYQLEPAFPSASSDEPNDFDAAIGGGDLEELDQPDESMGIDEVTDGIEVAAEHAEVTTASAAWTSYRQPFFPLDRESQATDNVGAVLRGRGNLADQWIVLGAHYDHVGYGGREQDGPVHPGADDNASGTAAIMIVAKRLTEQYTAAGDDANLRSILFLAFSAEEMGLLGSQYFVRHSTIPAEKISIMINLDMIGRLREGEMIVGGVHSAEGLLDLIRPHLLATGLTIHADPHGQGPSDHASFYGSGIPVLFFFTGVHDAYHEPGDVGSSVDPRGAIKVIDLVHVIAYDRATEPEMLKFLRSSRDDLAEGERRVRPPRPRATVGLVPGRLPEGSPEGVRVSILTENSPAANAGVQVEDIITAWNGEAVSSYVAWNSRLKVAKPGEEVTLTIVRGEEQLEIKVTLGERQ